MSQSRTRGPNLVYNCEYDGKELSVNDILSLRICERMASLHLTEQEVCDRTGGVVTPTMLSKYIHKKSEPSAYKLQKLAEALECSMDYLMDHENALPELDSGNHIHFYTGLTPGAIRLLYTRERANKNRKYESDDQARPTDTGMLGQILEAEGNHLLNAVLAYTETVQKCRKFKARFEQIKPQRLTPDERQQCHTETEQALRDLNAAENRLMRCFYASVIEANGSAKLLDELDQQERSLRTMRGGSSFL